MAGDRKGGEDDGQTHLAGVAETSACRGRRRRACVCDFHANGSLNSLAGDGVDDPAGAEGAAVSPEVGRSRQGP